MASAQRTANVGRPAVPLMDMDSIRIHYSGERGITIGEIRQLQSRCQVNLLREDLEVRRALEIGEGPRSTSPSNASSFSGRNLSVQRSDLRKSESKKKPSNVGVSSNRKRGGRGPSKPVSVRRGRIPFRPTCLFCGKVLPRMSKLEIHLRVHTKERPFHCSKCPEAFSNEGNLKSHVRTVHDRVRGKLKCQLCSKRFHHRGNLNDHIRRHLGEKRYSCNVCQKEFVRVAELGNHKTIHFSVRPFKCARCGSAFKLKSHLWSHKRTCQVSKK